MKHLVYTGEAADEKLDKIVDDVSFFFSFVVL